VNQAGIDEIRQSLKKLHRSSKRTKLGMKDPHSKTLLRRDSKDVQQQMTEALEQAFHDLKKKDDDLRYVGAISLLALQHTHTLDSPSRRVLWHSFRCDDMCLYPHTQYGR